MGSRAGRAGAELGKRLGVERVEPSGAELQKTMSAVAFFALAAERSLRVCSCRPQLRLSTLLHRSIDPYMNLQLSPWRIDKASPVETSKFRVRHKAEHGRVGAALVCLHPVEVPSAKAKAACMFQVDGTCLMRRIHWL